MQQERSHLTVASVRELERAYTEELAFLRLAADKVRVFAYGVVTANDGVRPLAEQIYLRAMLADLDRALGLVPPAAPAGRGS